MIRFLLRCVSLFYFALFVCPVTGQVAKKNLTSMDYGLWSSLSAGSLSDNGKWASYLVSYESGADTLFVRHTDGRAMYHFANAQQGRFFGKAKFSCLQSDASLNLTNLQTGFIQHLNGVQHYEISKGNYIIAEAISDSLNKQLIIYNEDGYICHSIRNVRAWSYNSKCDIIICQAGVSGKQKLFLIPLSKPFNEIKIAQRNNDGSASDFTWQDNGQSVAFLLRNRETVSIGMYRIATAQYIELKPENFAKLKPGKTITSTSFTPLRISDDGQRVFFGIENKTASNIAEGIELWNTKDRVIYPDKVSIEGFEVVNKTACWMPDTNSSVQLTDNELPYCMINSSGSHALLWNPRAYQPQQKQFGDTDYYLLDIETGAKKLLLERQVGDERQTFFSATGKFVTYFRDDNWWSYSIKTGKTVNLTGKLFVPIKDLQYDWAGDVPSYGCPGWTKDDSALLVYDEFDVWKISLNGNMARLTNGRENGTVFRIVPQNYLQHGGINYSGRMTGVFDLSKELWFMGENNNRIEYYRWNVTNGCKLAIGSRNSLSSLKTNAIKTALYVEQSYNLPPRLMYLNGKGSQKQLFQSNPQHFRYNWGRPEIVSYYNSRGQQLQGILYYPTGYDSTKNYPMIVRIYEKQSWAFYDYVNPSTRSQSGYNKTNFVTQGYFVFEPDINYEMGNPGLSAVDCVTAAVKSILDIPGVDRKRIGLIGNSFGGYQTNMIICKSDLFAAAVAGSGISDLTSHFFCVNDNSSRPNNYHFESGQFRMANSIFENPDGYAANSPLNFVQNLKTPLLSWTGKDDPQVSPRQSMEFHLALRRLGKYNIMLVYPNETHAMMKRADQEDLTVRIREWFGYYLKGEPQQSWMKPDQY